MLSAFRPAVLAAFACVLSAAALAQEGAQAPKPPPSPTLDAITDVADALGMIRGVQREWRSVNRIYYIASGTVTTGRPGPNYKLTRGFFEMSFAQHAVRADQTFQLGSSPAVRSILVARGDAAWNETLPGVGATPQPGKARERLWLLYTVPHGAVRAAMEAFVKDASSVKLVVSGQIKTFDFKSPAGPLRIVADAADRPVRIELTLEGAPDGPSTVVTGLSDYRDWEKLGVWFPARIRQTVDGASVADLTVSEFRTNPYVVFPYPPGLAPAGPASGD